MCSWCLMIVRRPGKVVGVHKNAGFLTSQHLAVRTSCRPRHELNGRSANSRQPPTFFTACAGPCAGPLRLWGSFPVPQKGLAEADDPNQSWPDEVVKAPGAPAGASSSNAKAAAAGPPGGAFAVDVDARGSAAAGGSASAARERAAALPVAAVEPDSMAAHAAGSVTRVNGANALVVPDKPSGTPSSAVVSRLPADQEGAAGLSATADAALALASRPQFADPGASTSAQPAPGLEDPQSSDDSLRGGGGSTVFGGAVRRPPPVGLPSPDPWQPYPTSHLPTVRTRDELLAAAQHSWEAHPSNLPQVQTSALA